MGFLEKILPGYKGYKERENGRDSDKKLREHFSNRLKEGRSRYDDIKAQIADRGNLDLLKPAEKVTQTLSLVIDRLRYANYGFTGKWFGKDKVDADRLENVLAFDQQLAEGVDKAVGDIASLQLLDDNAAISSALQSLARDIREMDEALNRREEILRAVGGEPEK